jgi:hypothetical protein
VFGATTLAEALGGSVLASVLTPAAFAGVFRVHGRIGRESARGDPVVVCHPLD